MAKVQVLVIKCDKCGTESTDSTNYYHVTVSTIAPLDDKKARAQGISVKDLCKACVGAPGVNVEP
jgi:hypothetical protein